MKQPTAKAIFFFVGILGVGYAIGLPVMTGILHLPLNLATFLNLSAFAFLFAVLMTIWLDRPLELELFNWPEKKARTTQGRTEEDAVISSPSPVQPQRELREGGPDYYPQVKPGALFPHETPSEHWNVDFGDSKQVYQGSELPVWILAGWAVFLIWAIVYLVSGLPAAF